MHSRPQGAVLVCHGARATEDALFAAVDAALAERPPEALARPIRILVPSRSLREHVAMALLRRRGRALLGLGVHTVYGFAAEICARVDGVLPRGRTLTRLTARRAAARNRDLRAELAHLEDGPQVVVPSVRDLIDAGLDAALSDAAPARIARALDGDDRDLVRGRALFAVAREAQAETAHWRGGGAAALLRRARAHLAAGASSSPAWAIFVHGFAEATEAVTALLEHLVAGHGARVFLDQPPDPGRDPRDDFGAAHPRRLAARLASAAGGVGRVGRVEAALTASRPAAFSARGPDEEAWQVATRILDLLGRGERPEGIAVVARDLGDYRLALRSRFARLGIPFSGVGEVGPAGPAARVATALATLLTRGVEAPAERWLELLAENPRSGIDARVAQDVRVAFHSLGAARVTDVAGLDAGAFLDAGDGLGLMVRQGLRGARGPGAPHAADVDGPGMSGDESGDDDRSIGGEDDRAQPDRGLRRVAGAHIRYCIRAARELVRALSEWPPEAEVQTHAGWLRGLLGGILGSATPRASALPAVDAVEAALADLPGRLRVERDELTRILASALANCGRPPLGGAGGGVQVLSVSEARARTHDHLFVIGLNRDVFPRVVTEDPLLPDHVRVRLAEDLPSLATKRAPGFHEERYLFAQLLSSSPSVTLSWQRSDDDGRPRAPSPLLERLGVEVGVVAHETAALARDVTDLAVEVGLGATRSEARPVLRVLAEEAARDLGAGATTPARLAGCREAVLDELDPDRRTRDGNLRARELGPYLGFLGPIAGDDPRADEPFVTGIEKLVACGWQYFLENLLRLERLPDPLAALPSVDPLVLGEVVHGVLERIVRDGIARDDEETLEQALSRGPREVPWPSSEALSSWLRAAAEGAVRAAGTGLSGIASLYVELARPQLEAARAVDWTVRGTVAALGAEVLGRLVVDAGDGGAAAVRFRVDRVDRQGSLARLTDYKTGHRGVSSATQAAKRREHLLTALREGRFLQPAVYALGAGDGAIGRLLYLSAEVPAELREVAIDAADGEVEAAVRDVAGDAFAALAAGSLLPRVVVPSLLEEPRRCDACRVAEACVRGDSGARGRIVTWVRRSAAGDVAMSAAERTWLRLWHRAAGGAPGSARG